MATSGWVSIAGGVDTGADVEVKLNTAFGNIDTEIDRIVTAEADIVQNTADITTNANAIAANALAISNNAAGIATNVTNISANTIAIGTNTSDIATNTANIATNTADIATNVLAIQANASAIAGLTIDVDTNTTAISGLVTDVGTNTTSIATNASDITSVSNRVTALESTHSVLLNATSTASSQQPVALDTPLQVEFGALQTTADIDISATGAITFKTAGKYILAFFFQYGRTGAAGTSHMLNRLLVNGTQLGNTLGAKVDNSDVLVPWSSTVQLTVNANDVITTEIVRDSAGDNSGGLFALTPTIAGWNNAPCASVQIFRAV